MKPILQLKLSQQLKLSPQLQQAIRLLQLSTVDLNHEIEHVVQENPMLERNDGDIDFRHRNESDWFQENKSFYSLRDNNDEKYDLSQLKESPFCLREHLNLQVSLSHMAEQEKKIVGLLIDSLDDDGYLTQDLGGLIELLPQSLKIGEDDLQMALEYLQCLDPLGVGARNLRECLSIQLRALPQDTCCRDEALLLVSECLESLASKNFKKIKQLIGCDDACIRSIQSLIVSLNPKPGSIFGFNTTRYVTPDVLVNKVNGTWVVSLNPEVVPDLKINHSYANIIKGSKNESVCGLASYLKEAKWLISNIDKHFNTILEVSNVIVERQRQFFEHGDVAMRPLVIKEVANTLGLNESTISRVTTQKFMRTPQGIFELKYFFGSYVTTDTGGACSATAIRSLIKQLIQTENIKKPLSDNRISGLLEKQGIIVARRTIAKYRESMKIPPANLRKLF